MQLVIRVVGVALTPQRRIEAQVIRASRYGMSHDDMDRVYSRIREEAPVTCGLRVTENTITFTTRLTDLNRSTVGRFRKVIDAALSAQLV
jgi:hypothetical protein